MHILKTRFVISYHISFAVSVPELNCYSVMELELGGFGWRIVVDQSAKQHELGREVLCSTRIRNGWKRLGHVTGERSKTEKGGEGSGFTRHDFTGRWSDECHATQCRGCMCAAPSAMSPLHIMYVGWGGKGKEPFEIGERG